MQGETKIFYLVVHSPNGCNGQGWARPKAGAQNSTRVSHVGGRDYLDHLLLLSQVL